MIGLEYILRLNDISYTKLADELGIKRQNITCWLNQKQNISKKHLPALSKKFGIPEDYLQKEIKVQSQDIRDFVLKRENDKMLFQEISEQAKSGKRIEFSFDSVCDSINISVRKDNLVISTYVTDEELNQNQLDFIVLGIQKMGVAIEKKGKDN